MSEGGGDIGGGSGDSGGGGKGGGYNGLYDSFGGGNDYGGNGGTNYGGGSGGGASYVNLDNPTGGNSGYSFDNPTSGVDPSSFTGGGGGNTGPTVDEFVSNPTGGNLGGPGPVGGDSGLPFAGGGTNTPMSWDNMTLPNLDGVSADQFSGTPTSAGGVFDSGTGAITSSTPFDSLVSGNSAGASAAGTAAPSSVSGNTDISSQNLTPTAKPTGSSGSSGGGSSGILDSLGLGKGNAAGALVSGAGLLNNLITGNKAPPQSGALTANANAASATSAQQTAAGQALQQWQTTGKLPDAYEQQVQKAAQDAKTKAISNAAAQGLPTDPTLNTALAQQINAIDAAIPQQKEAIASQLAATGQQMINAGLQATGISSGVYQTLANLENSQNQAKGQAIANFASALNGGGNKGLTLKVA